MKMIKFELAILSVLSGISSFGMVTSTHLNYTYRFDVYTLENCPKNAHEFETAAKRKNCTENSRYLCAPDKYLSNLIEFCTDRPVSLFKNGYCVRLEGTGDLNHYRCEDKFQRGCPTEPYTDEEIYKYPACLEINIGFHCFAADKDCPERLDKYVSNNSKKEESINTTNTEKSDGSIKSHGAIVICVVYALMMTTVTGIIAFFVIRQRNKKNMKKTEILLLERMPDEKISIKTGPLRIEISKGESGTDTCEREEKEIKTVVKMGKDIEITIRHTRGIIVNCRGAGKTTLLKRLKGTSYHDLQKIQSTVIADVHPNCFEVLEEDQNIKYVGSDRTKPTILLHEGMLHEKRSIKTDLLETEITRKEDSGTDSRKRKDILVCIPRETHLNEELGKTSTR